MRAGESPLSFFMRSEAMPGINADEDNTKEIMCSAIMENQLKKIHEEYNVFAAAVMEETENSVADEVSKALAQHEATDAAVIGYTRFAECCLPGARCLCPGSSPNICEPYTCNTSDTESCGGNLQFADKCMKTTQQSKVREFFAKREKQIQQKTANLLDKIKLYSDQINKFQLLKQCHLKKKTKIEAFALESSRNVQRIEMELKAIRACVCRCHGDSLPSEHFCCQAKTVKVSELQNRLESVRSMAIKKEFYLQMCRDSENRLITGNKKLKLDIKYLIRVAREYRNQIGKIQSDVCKVATPPRPQSKSLSIFSLSTTEVPTSPSTPPPSPPSELLFPPCVSQPSLQSTTECQSPSEKESDPLEVTNAAPDKKEVPKIDRDGSTVFMSQQDEDNSGTDFAEDYTTYNNKDSIASGSQNDHDAPHNKLGECVSDIDSCEKSQTRERDNKETHSRDESKCKYYNREGANEILSQYSIEYRRYYEDNFKVDDGTIFHEGDGYQGQYLNLAQGSSFETGRCKTNGGECIPNRTAVTTIYSSQSDSSILKIYQMQNLNLIKAVNHLTVQLNITRTKLMQYHKCQEELLEERADIEKLINQVAALRKQNALLVEKLESTPRSYSNTHDLTSQPEVQRVEENLIRTSSLTSTQRIDNLETLISILSIQNQSNYRDYQEYRNMIDSYRNDIRCCILQLSKPADSFKLLVEPSDPLDQRDWIQFSKKALRVAQEAKLSADRKALSLEMIEKERERILSENFNLRKKLNIFADIQKQFLKNYFGPQLRAQVDQLTQEVGQYKGIIEKLEKDKHELIQGQEKIAIQKVDSKESIKDRANEVAKRNQDFNDVHGQLEAQKSGEKMLNDQLKCSQHIIEEYELKLRKYELDLTAARQVIERLMSSPNNYGSHASSVEAVLRVNTLDSPFQPEKQSIIRPRRNSFRPSKACLNSWERKDASDEIEYQSAEKSLTKDLHKLPDSIKNLRGIDGKEVERLRRDKYLQLLCSKIMERGIGELDFKSLLFLHQVVYDAGVEARKKLVKRKHPVWKGFGRQNCPGEREYSSKVVKLHQIEKEVKKAQNILKYIQQHDARG